MFESCLSLQLEFDKRLFCISLCTLSSSPSPTPVSIRKAKRNVEYQMTAALPYCAPLHFRNHFDAFLGSDVQMSRPATGGFAGRGTVSAVLRETGTRQKSLCDFESGAPLRDGYSVGHTRTRTGERGLAMVSDPDAAPLNPVASPSGSTPRVGPGKGSCRPPGALHAVPLRTSWLRVVETLTP